jgi:hypothetical protein
VDDQEYSQIARKIQEQELGQCGDGPSLTEIKPKPTKKVVSPSHNDSDASHYEALPLLKQRLGKRKQIKSRYEYLPELPLTRIYF